MCVIHLWIIHVQNVIGCRLEATPFCVFFASWAACESLFEIVGVLDPSKAPGP